MGLNENASLGSGQRIADRYIIESLIGSGGYGDVYLAKQISTGQNVAIKVLNRPGSTNYERRVARFKRETALIAQLHHSHIVKLLDSGTLENGMMYMVLEYIEGTTLKRELEENGPLSLVEAMRLMTQVMEAIAAAHAKGVVHRDLKPANIMISRTGQRRNALVLDFGISTLVASEERVVSAEVKESVMQAITHTGELQGTPAYMSPEQLKGEVCEASDIYSWALIFIECLTGKQVVCEPSIADSIVAQLSEDPIVVPTLEDVRLTCILKKASEKQVSERYQNAEDVLNDLELCSKNSIFSASRKLEPYQKTGVTISETLDHRDFSETAFDETVDIDVKQTEADDAESSIEFNGLIPIDVFPEENELYPILADSDSGLARRTTDVNPRVVPAGRDGYEVLRTHPSAGELMTSSPMKKSLWGILTAILVILAFFVSVFLPELSGANGIVVSQGLFERLAISVVMSVFLIIGAHRTRQFWQNGRWSQWLHGYGVALVPLIGFFFVGGDLFYIKGVHGAFDNIILGYNQISRSMADAMRIVSHDGTMQFLSVSSMTQLMVGAISVLLLFGYLFAKPAKGYEITEENLAIYINRHRKRDFAAKWGVLLVTAVLLGLYEFGVCYWGTGFDPMDLMPSLVWLLTLYILTVQKNPILHGRVVSWWILISGLTAFLASNGFVMSVLAMRFQMLLLQYSEGSLSVVERSWLFYNQWAPVILRQMVIQLAIVFLSGISVLISGRKQFFVRYISQVVDHPFRWGHIVPALVMVASMWGLVVYGTFISKDSTHFINADQLPMMLPLKLDNGSFFYIDRLPESITDVQHTLPMRIYQVDSGRRALPTNKTYALNDMLRMGRNSNAICTELIQMSLKLDSMTPCLTGIEAEMVCELKGMRLPTKAEYEAAIKAGLSEIYPLEWTRRVVQETEEYTVYIPDKSVVESNRAEIMRLMKDAYPRESDDELKSRWDNRFSELKLDQYRDNVYFRCVYTP